MSVHNLRKAISLLCLYVFFAILLPNPSSGSDTDHSPDSILSQYQLALTKLEEDFKHCSGEVMIVRSSPTADGLLRVTERSRTTFAFSGTRGITILTEEPIVDGDGTNPTQAKRKKPQNYQMVSAYNSDYSMALMKKIKDSEFLIRWLDNRPALAGKEVTRISNPFLRAPLRADGFSMGKLMESEGFHVEQITPMKQQEKPDLFRISFTIPPKDIKTLNAMQISSGWFIVDPERQWALNEFGIVASFTGSKKTTRVGHIQYDPSSHDKPKMISYRHQLYDGDFGSDPAILNPEVKPRFVVDYSFTRFDFGDRPDREFRLSAFGLPEYGQTVKQAVASRTYPWWILGVAVGLGLLAFWLRRLGSRTAGKTSGSQPAV